MKIDKAKRKRFLLSCLLGVALFFYFGTLAHYGEEYRRKAAKTKPISAFTALRDGWKYQAGDDAQWSSAAFDDHAWPVVKSDSLPDNYDGRLTWFRISFREDPSYLNIPLVLNIRHCGASDIFFDGKHLASNGTTAPSKEKEVCYDPANECINIGAGDTALHTIAIRYSEFDRKIILANTSNYFSGFLLSVYKAGTFTEERNKHDGLMFFIVACGIFLFTLSFVHFLLYFFYRKATDNLHYALFAFCFGSVFILQYFINNGTDPVKIYYCEKLFSALLNPVLFLSIINFTFRIFRNKFGVSWYVALGMGSLGILYAFTDLLSRQYFFITLSWFIIFNVIGMAQGTLKLLKEKRTGAKILSTGMGVFSAFLFAAISMLYFFRNFDFALQIPGVLLAFLLFFLLMSIPISTSIYLAFVFANTNRKLSEKLEEVKTLSEKSIEQEKEKQKILENQKEMLEQQVNERTAEIVQQKEVIEEKNKSITDSIMYAKRIQDAQLPKESFIQRTLKRLRD